LAIAPRTAPLRLAMAPNAVNYLSTVPSSLANKTRPF